MHVLMIAPEPFFEPRGTPFSEYHRIRALLDLGHTVDLVTYPFGQDVTLPGLRIFRSARPPFVTRVRIGPSLVKVPLDALLALSVFVRMGRRRYDVVHSHEEGMAIGLLVSWLFNVPHVYDMHSSLPQQLTNFAFSQSRALRAAFAWLERLAVRRSAVVVVICRHLQELVAEIDGAAETVLIENAPGAGKGSPSASPPAVRESLGLGATTPFVLYTGTFEPYQGLDLLTEATARVVSEVPEVRVVLVGGTPEQVDALRRRLGRDGLDRHVLLTGERPADAIPALLESADVLVSPRSTGTNTPLKIYQYLRAGKPIVATRLLTHTQVLGDDVAVLTAATPDAFAAGIVQALTDRSLAERLGSGARALAESKYTYEAYLERTRTAYALVPLGSAG